MSRNNLILVIRFRSRYWVVPNANADTEWSERFARLHVRRKGARFTKDRATALILAHDIQLRLNTEYGVREMSISS